jgi:hypothetical protein
VLPTANWAILGSMPKGDIEALAILVLMQASESAQADVRAVMESVEAINATKAKLRETLQQRQKLAGQADGARLPDGETLGSSDKPAAGGAALPGCTAKQGPDTKDGCINTDDHYPPPDTKEALNSQIDQIRQDLEAMSDLSETESLRLQMAMDRASNVMSTLSNLLKGISDTAAQITHNLK